MDNSVIIKSSKNGITLILDEEISFDELKKKVKEKFKNASKFFNNANLALSFEGKSLTKDEEREILDIISEVSDMCIVCVVDKDHENEKIFTDAVTRALKSVQKNDSEPSCYFYKGTLRSGQVFESESSVVILGDVNPGGKVVAKGNVIVLGSLRGNIFAGVNGNEHAFVVALEMNPMQIKIGDVIARSSDANILRKKRKSVLQPKIAYVYEGNIYIEDLSSNTLEDIVID